jgi:hypothetical protein
MVGYLFGDLHSIFWDGSRERRLTQSLKLGLAFVCPLHGTVLGLFLPFCFRQPPSYNSANWPEGESHETTFATGDSPRFDSFRRYVLFRLLLGPSGSDRPWASIQSLLADFLVAAHASLPVGSVSIGRTDGTQRSPRW